MSASNTWMSPRRNGRTAQLSSNFTCCVSQYIPNMSYHITSITHIFGHVFQLSSTSHSNQAWKLKNPVIFGNSKNARIPEIGCYPPMVSWVSNGRELRALRWCRPADRWLRTLLWACPMKTEFAFADASDIESSHDPGLWKCICSIIYSCSAPQLCTYIDWTRKQPTPLGGNVPRPWLRRCQFFFNAGMHFMSNYTSAAVSVSQMEKQNGKRENE